jgi:hypothetical protein
MSERRVLLAPLDEDEVWTGVSGTVLVCLDGHRFGAWANDEGAKCPDCGGVLRIEQDDE